MRQSLLISAATAVLLSASFAAAQDRPASAPPSVAPPTSAAPAEKMDTKGAPGTPKGAERPTTKQKQTETPAAPAQPRAAKPGDAQTPPAARQPSQAQSPQTPKAPATTETRQDKSSPSTTTETRQDKSGAPTTTQTRQEKSTTSATSTTITTEQRTRIRETVLRPGNAPRVSNVNFQINIGVVVPRTVRVAPLPVTIVEIQPSWRGYMYFIVDDEIIIVEPGTLRIVAVIPA